MKLYKILGLNVKMKTDGSEFWPIMTVKLGIGVLKCDEYELRLSWLNPQLSVNVES